MMKTRIEYDWRNRYPSHSVGQDFLYYDEFVFVFIPKNASGFMRSVFTQARWKISLYNFCVENLRAVAVVRDPYERWLSGMAQHLNDCFGEDALAMLNDFHFKRWLSINPIVDDHTEQQVYFLQGVDIDNATFFEYGPKLNQNLCKFLAEHDIQVRIRETDRGNEGTKPKKQIETALRHAMRDMKAEACIYDHLAQDIELYKHLKNHNLYYR